MRNRTFQWGVLALGILGLSLPALAQAEAGPYLQIGPAGIFQIGGENRDLEGAPAVQAILGYDWDRAGIRGRFLVASGEDDERPLGGRDTGVETVIATIEGRIFVMDEPFRPYIVGGGGAYFLTEGSVEDNDNASGVGGNFGFGIDYQVTDYLHLGIENGFHFVGFVEDEPPRPTGPFEIDNAHNGFLVVFYTLGANIRFNF